MNKIEIPESLFDWFTKRLPINGCNEKCIAKNSFVLSIEWWKCYKWSEANSNTVEDLWCCINPDLNIF